MLKNRGKGSMNETILLIEDNESIIMGLEYLLTEEQYTFLAAKTKKEAQDLLASRQVDLVLLDVTRYTRRSVPASASIPHRLIGRGRSLLASLLYNDTNCPAFACPAICFVWIVMS